MHLTERPDSGGSLLVRANRAARAGLWADACGLYLQALWAQPDATWLRDNLLLLGRQYRRRPRQGAPLSVGVCGWELSHNAAGRVQMLAELYATFAQVEVLGCHFPTWGRALWPPLLPPTVPVHSFVVDDEAQFLHQAVQLVAAHPHDVVHLSKPRAPNLIFGLLYKLLWGARVLVDVDDEELAFVREKSPLSLQAWLAEHPHLPPLHGLPGAVWTRLAVGLVGAFDGVTVSNPALAGRYGGQLVRHARDEARFAVDVEARARSRARFGIAAGCKVVLFFGTPRAHKGLVETAEAIAQLPSRDVIFVVAGEFEDDALRQRLLAVSGCEMRLLGTLPWAEVPQVVAMADVCVLLQRQDALVSAFQVPAKMSDALALGVPVLTQRTPALAEFIDDGAVMEVGPQGLTADLWRVLTDEALRVALAERARSVFLAKLSFAANAAVLKGLCEPAMPVSASTTLPWPDPPASAGQGPRTLQDLVAPGLYGLTTPPKLLLPANAGATANAVTTAAANAAADATVAPAAAAATVAVVCHVYHLDIWPELVPLLQALPEDVGLYLTTSDETATALHPAVQAASLGRARLVVGPNRGMDILPFMRLLPTLHAQGCQVVLKLHTKRGTGAAAHRWRRWMLQALAGSLATVRAVIQAFEAQPDLALAGPAALYLGVERLSYANGQQLGTLLQKLGLPAEPGPQAGFFAGTMFWCRVSPLLPLAREAVRLADALTEAGAGAGRGGGGGGALVSTGSTAGGDGQLEHALERMFGPAALAGGGKLGLLHPPHAQAGPQAPWVMTVHEASQGLPGKGHVGEIMRAMVTLEADAAALRASQVFDEANYRAQASELRSHSLDPVLHYLTRGAWMSWQPAPAFTGEAALRQHLRAVGGHGNALALHARCGADPAVWKVLAARPDHHACRFTLQRSGLFDEAFYRGQLDPDETGAGEDADEDAIAHYLSQGVFRGLWPHPGFDPLAYLVAHRDVLAAGVEPFFHYLTAGAREGRTVPPSPLRYGSLASPVATAAATSAATATVARTGSMTTISASGVSSPPSVGPAASGEVPRLGRWEVLNRMLIDWRSLSVRRPLSGRVSIVIPILDQLDLTRACLQSLLDTPAGADFEILAVDNGSTAATGQWLANFARGSAGRCRVLSLPHNHQFALGCNLGFAQAQGGVLVFLNNDTTVTPGWLGSLVTPLHDPSVMAVQPRLLFPDGTVQCAGVVFSERQSLGYPLYVGLPGDAPAVMRQRDLQAVTGACLAVRAADFAKCKGFDPVFVNGQEDVDLCLRLTSEPDRVCRYEPAATVYHHEARTPGRFDHSRSNRQTFIARWRGRIRADDLTHYASDGFEVVEYAADSEANEKLGVAVYRPRLVAGRAKG